jgi:uncharacterized protein
MLTLTRKGVKAAQLQAILWQSRTRRRNNRRRGVVGCDKHSIPIRRAQEQEAQVVGKFLLGMVSGGLLVAGGLVVASAVAPIRSANDNEPVAEAVTADEAPITAPEATEADAGTTAPKAVPDEVEPGAADATAAPAATGAETVKAEPAAEPEPAPVAQAPGDAQPAIVGADSGPTAPDADAAALVEPAAPTLSAVAAPEPATAPVKPAEAAADVAAATPEPAAPAPVVEPAPVADPDPVAEPSAETQLADADATDPVPPVPETTAPTEEPAAIVEEVESGTQIAESAPEAELPTEAEPEPAPELEAAALPTPEADGSEAATDLPQAESEPLPEMAAPAAEEPGAATVELPGTQPEAMPGTPAALPVETADAADPSKTFVPEPGLVRAGEGLIIGRGTAEATPDPAVADPAAEPVADPNAAPGDPRPIVRFAATFENPDAKPPLAVVLIDRGQPDLDRAALANLPFPVSFALDPLDPATPDRAAAYRAAGREVVMLVTGIATGAQASDVEVAFQSMEQGLPEAVAVMDLAEPAFQNNRGLASAVVPILKAQGRGLLTWDEGLNAADQVARREDLEAAVVFRDLGAAGADRVAIRRLLDRAVFKAGQDGRVSVVGEADAETVAALLEWSVEGKAATVALAPLTAVLKVD